MENNTSNRSIKIYGSILLILTLIIGFLIGMRVAQRNTQERFFIYPSVSKIDALLDLIEENYVDSISKKDLIEKSIPEILSNLDPHSVYIPPAELSDATESLEGNFEGVGIQFNVQNDTVLIINTISGGPSAKVGILPGDRIVKINDSVFVGKKINSEKVIKKLKGKRGTIVKVSVLRRGVKELINFEIERDKIPLYSVDVSYLISPEMGYIKIERFARTTYEEFLSAMQKLKSQGIKKLILDLRGNGGGYMDIAIQLADEFLPQNTPILYTEGRKRERQTFSATQNGCCEDIEVAVLVDTWSASASEIVAGALQDNDKGIIIGRRTFGKGLVQEPTMFRDGSSVRLTVSRYFTPTGRCIQKPYNKGEKEYENDIFERIKKGEMSKIDSTKFPDSLKYKTPKGKTVYGGGGIMPDIFVPIDTSDNSKYLELVTNKGLIYRFALEFADSHRKELSHIKDYRTMCSHLTSLNILNLFVNFAQKNGVSPIQRDIEISRKLIQTELCAYISRDLLGDENYYFVIKDVDNVLQKAIETLSKKKN